MEMEVGSQQRGATAAMQRQGAAGDGARTCGEEEGDVEIVEFTCDDSGKNLLVSNLDPNVHFADLQRIFCRFGLLREIQLKEPGEFMLTRFAFVKFCSKYEARKAKRAVHRRVKLRGRYVHVSMCTRERKYDIPLSPSFSVSMLHHYLGVGSVSMEVAYVDQAALRHTAFSFFAQQQQQQQQQQPAQRQRGRQAAPAMPQAPAASQRQYHSHNLSPAQAEEVHAALTSHAHEDRNHSPPHEHTAATANGDTKQDEAEAVEAEEDTLLIVVCAHVTTLPSPVYGGCLQSMLPDLLQRQVRAPFTPTRCLEVAHKLAHTNAAKNVFEQLRLVRVYSGARAVRWVPAIAPLPPSRLQRLIQSYLQLLEHGPATADTIIDPFVDVPDDHDDGNDDAGEGESEGDGDKL
ncbi:hypothetical protein PTSG_04321 [Salpingoeca rosetta]|uniref:RRM domain-containing protein n=1 Tax=Salpingoeca rosetta (strain ATCC 50818 / BSB-021) TaxID=946362 RepID=F2U878_SALR5|nr:uncharacterized protein PTSG_04321 [Salpingoeca rosetta]EGD72586.1 hypothetical protein PTSG_04321 [Salpingoeca rosetta]|eukprot:XP_004994409.1 hypothetical protein PTSG_04321 [Salpingoeca rosetta]